MAHSFVAIELLAFSKMQDSVFIAQESSHYLGKKHVPYVKRIDFIYFWVYKNVFQKYIALRI